MDNPPVWHTCAICGRWRNTNPVCGICRASRGFGELARDSRVQGHNIQSVVGILDRTLGEIHGLLTLQPVSTPPSILPSPGGPPAKAGGSPDPSSGATPAAAGAVPGLVYSAAFKPSEHFRASSPVTAGGKPETELGGPKQVRKREASASIRQVPVKVEEEDAQNARYARGARLGLGGHRGVEAGAPSDSLICAGGRPAFGPDLRPPLPRRGGSSASFQGRGPPANPYPGWTGESQKKKKKQKNKGLKHRQRGEQRKAERLARETGANQVLPTGDTDESSED